MYEIRARFQPAQVDQLGLGRDDFRTSVTFLPAKHFNVHEVVDNFDNRLVAYDGSA